MTVHADLKAAEQLARRKIVYFEPGSGGHQQYYAELLLRGARQSDHSLTIVVCAHPAIVRSLEVMEGMSRVEKGRVEFIAHSESEVRKLSGGSLFARGLYAWNLAQTRALEAGANHLYISYFDHAIVGALLNLFSRNSDYTISGLVFRPVQHYRKWSRKPGLNYWFSLVKKSVFYSGANLNRQISTLFCLDDFYIDYLQRKWKGVGKFVYLPDPAPLFLMAEKEKTDSTATTGQQDEEKKVSFILFGSLQRRKGVLQALSSLNYLSQEAASKSSFHIVGKVSADIKDEVYEQLGSLQLRRPDIDIVVTDSFLSDEDLTKSVSAADVVLAPYQKFVGSSGVLIWAITFRKPVITQDFGYLGRFVSEENLGLSIDTTSPRILAVGIERMISEHAEFLLSSTDRDRLLSRLSPDAFTSVLLGSWEKSIRAERC